MTGKKWMFQPGANNEINTEQTCSKSVVVSVIVPVYNVEHYLKQCLDSIISQTFSNVLEQSVIPAPLSLRRPEWLKDGITVESEAETMQLVLECKRDGELEVDLMGRDIRNANGMRYPVWIDCTYFAVNGEAVFAETKTVCTTKGMCIGNRWLMGR